MIDRNVFDEILTPPGVGEVLDLGLEIVECRACSCCAPDTSSGGPRYYVYSGALELLAMGHSWRRLAHHRGWQLDPMEVWRHPQSWPESEMNPYQLATWHELRVHLDLGDTAEPIAAAPPICVVRRAPKPEPGRARDLLLGPVTRKPKPVQGKRRKIRPNLPPPKPDEPTLPPLPRGHADQEGQFSLWK